MTQRPLVGALAVVLKDDHALLARRINKPDAGLWGFPGGHVELGETALDAAARELREETGVIAKPVEYLTNIDVVRFSTDGACDIHYLLAAVLCAYDSGHPQAADDVAEAEWMPIDQILRGALPMSAQVDEVIRLAQARLGSDR